MANQSIDKVANVFSKLFNPLRTLTKPQIERMVNDWHHGDDVRLQTVFSQIEAQSPIYQVCISKRAAGVVNRKWDVVPKDQSAAAKAQADAVKRTLEDADGRNEDGLTEALRHLCLATFRGRSAVKPFFDARGLFFAKLQNWNFLEYQNRFWWNPSSEPTGWFDAAPPPGVTPLPKEEVCYVTDGSPVDVPGLMVYLRQLVGEEQWARFVEKQGIPQIVIEAPEGTPDQNLDQWNFRAMQLFEGGSGTLPNGAKVNVLDSARGQDPFSEYVKHQMEMVCIMSLGGTLLAMPGSTGLGSDLARVQQESFNSLVNQDCKRISNALTAGVVPKCVRRLFGPRAETLCRFTFVEDDEYSAQDYLEMAEKAAALGMKIDQAEFKRLTKLSFIQDQEEWTPPRSEGEESKEWTPAEKDVLRRQLEEA